MVNPVQIAAFAVTIIGVVATYLVYIHSAKPGATEIADELRQMLYTTSSNIYLDIEELESNILNVNVTDASNWIEELENPNRQRGYALFNEVFFGHAEISMLIDLDELPAISKIRSHPYYGQSAWESDREWGWQSFEVELIGQTVHTKVDFWTHSVRDGAVCNVRALAVVGRIIADCTSGQSDDFQDTPPFTDYIQNQPSLENIEEGIIKRESN